MKPRLVTLAKALAENPMVSEDALLFQGLPVNYLTKSLPEFSVENIHQAGRIAFLMRIGGLL